MESNLDFSDDLHLADRMKEVGVQDLIEDFVITGNRTYLLTIKGIIQSLENKGLSFPHVWALDMAIAIIAPKWNNRDMDI